VEGPRIVFGQIDSLIEPGALLRISRSENYEPPACSHMGTGQHRTARLVAAKYVDKGADRRGGKQRQRGLASIRGYAENEINAERAVVLASPRQIRWGNALSDHPPPVREAALMTGLAHPPPQQAGGSLSGDLERASISCSKGSWRNSRKAYYDPTAS
jgi:hypothetical protein